MQPGLINQVVWTISD